jgi:hypothetical protein
MVLTFAEPIDEQDDSGCTPLALAVCLNNEDALKYIFSCFITLLLPAHRLLLATGFSLEVGP